MNLDNLPIARELSQREKEIAAKYKAASPRERAAMTGDAFIEAAFASGEFTEADLWLECDPQTATFGDDAFYPVIAVYKDGQQVTEYPPRMLGVAEWHPLYPDLPLEHAAKILKERFDTEGELKFEERHNDEIARRERAHELLPEVLEQFPVMNHKFKDLQVTDWNREAMAICQKWVQNAISNIRMGKGLYLRHPQTGSGKTALLCVTAISALKLHGVHPRFVSTPSLMMSTFKEQNREIELAKQTDILILDDVDVGVKCAAPGNEPDSSRSRQVLYAMANYRYDKRLPIFWTSNTRIANQMQLNIGARSFRRITERGELLEFGQGTWDWGDHNTGGNE